MSISLRARTVYPVDRPPLDGGVVTIAGDQIVAVEQFTTAVGNVHDLGEVALVPGFVNAHTHLEFSHLRQPLGRPGMPLIEWLPLAIAERQNRGHSAEESIAQGVQESLLTGTCAVSEIATAEISAYTAESAVSFTLFLEVIGFSRARAESAIVAVEQRLAAAARQRLHVGLSPHAPYTVSPALVNKLVHLARERVLPVAMHLAESADELELLATGSGSFRELLELRSMWDAEAIPLDTKPLDYLRLLADAPRSLVIHGNYLDQQEHEFLAAHVDRMTLVYCPRTHAYFDHPPYPLAKLLSTGVRVALGTDSRASNPDLNVFEELRQVARYHSNVAAESILKMATLDAATALGLEGECGSITPGKFANLVALPAQADSLLEAFVGPATPTAIWLRGQKT